MADPQRLPRLFSIDPSQPFLPVLVDALISGRLIPGFRPLDDPLTLAGATILLPTRRAARALKEAFLVRLGGHATLLPRIRPIGDLDEDGFDPANEPLSTALEPTLTATQRVLAMARLVLNWRDGLKGALINPTTGRAPTLPSSPADAIHLATSLLQLMDQVASEGADLNAIAGLVPEDHAAHWELTLQFLKIVIDEWPLFLARSGRADPAQRRDAMIRTEAARLTRQPPAGPVIAAGSTGSIPSTATLLDAIARLPLGAVVLPGLDRHLDEASWLEIGSDDDPAHPPVAGHPQYGLKLLLRRMRATRAMVEVLAAEPDPVLAQRLMLLSEAMRPAGTTDSWARLAERTDAQDRSRAFAGVSIVQARSESEEALTIAMALRETLETPGATAALVTPDRELARRVAIELTRWGLEVDDSAGTALSRTPPAVFARLVAEVAIGGFDPVKLVALMQHPLAAFGLARPEARRRARILEIGALRGPAPRQGSAGLLAAIIQAEDEAQDRLARPPTARRRIGAKDWAAAHDLAGRIAEALQPLEILLDRRGPVDLADLVEAHLRAIEAAALSPATGDGGDGTGLAFAHEAGDMLAAQLAELTEAARAPESGMTLLPQDYPGFLKAILGDAPVRQRGGLESRLHIWGPLEARLQAVDRLVLGGLNEGIWPKTTRSDPWLSRPMRADLGLEPPERRIGLAAHDFVQGVAAKEVILSRSAKAGTSPTVASRWLQRLTTVAGEAATQGMAARGDRFVALARSMDHRGLQKAQSVKQPMPRPPVTARPKQLSVTAIETWIRDPYALYARHILKLEALEPIGAEPDGADRGTLIHDVLAQFIATWDGAATEEAIAYLLKLGDDRLADFRAFPEVVALWRPRLAKIAGWFVAEEGKRNPTIDKRIPEAPGRLEIPVFGEVFTLTARADRIDLLKDGSVAILDYKTGRPPTRDQVASLLSPQLPLEAAMLARRGFGDSYAAVPVSALTYLHLSGTKEGGTASDVATLPADKPDRPSALDLAEAAYARLGQLIGAYMNQDMPYTSRPRIMFETATNGDYDHLARVKEWAAGTGAEE